MIFSKERKFVFIHNPKVGGTSIRSALDQFHDTGQKLWHQQWFPFEQRIIDRAHLHATQWDSNNIAPETFVFGFVRDPYERFWSAVKEFDRRHGRDFQPTPNNLELLLTPANITYDWRFIHFCPQHRFFYRKDTCVADFIGRYEQINTGWDYVVYKIGPDRIPHTLPRERQSAVDASVDLVLNLKNDPRTLKLINRLYQLDFTLFSYPMRGEVEYKDTHGDRVEVLHHPLCNPILNKHLADPTTSPFHFSAGEQKELQKYEVLSYGCHK